MPSSTPRVLSYAQTVTEGRGAVVVFGSHTYCSPRPTLRGYIHIQEALAVVKQEPASALHRIIKASGLEVDITGMAAVDVLVAAVLILNTHSITGTLPFMRQATTEGKSPPWSYEGRSVIGWVHLLASHYGWSEDAILDLHPEAVMCFAQEIAVAKQLAFEEQRTLHRLAYDEKGKYIPPKRPEWMRVPLTARALAPVPKAMLPKGNVVILGAKTYATH